MPSPNSSPLEVQVMSNRFEDVESYLAAQSPSVRSTLELVRAAIKAAVPDAEEVISYQIPTFKRRGSLIAYGAGKNHCALYVMSEAVMDRFAEELESYDNAKTTLRFPVGSPPPADLVGRLARARVDETDAARKR
jgi:uncharacterized protein YdhG (YjbR/CyaY superfamily)